MSRNFSVHCDNCQSFPDGYYCDHGSTFHKGKDGKWRARECWYNSLYLPEWKYHPCPFFTGEIRFHQDENGKWYDNNHYARICINREDGEFKPEELVEVHY